MSRNPPFKRPSVQLALVALLFAGPLLAALWLYYGADSLRPAGRTHGRNRRVGAVPRQAEVDALERRTGDAGSPDCGIGTSTHELFHHGVVTVEHGQHPLREGARERTGAARDQRPDGR